MNESVRFRYLEVQHTKEENRLKVVVPVSFWCLCGDGKGAVVQCSFTKVPLFADLHLNNEFPDLLGSALNIEYCITVFQGVARMFHINK